MKIILNASLRTYHTFGFEVSARYLLIISSLEDLESLFCDASKNQMLTGKDGWLVLGEGNNILFTRDFEGAIILMRIQGVNVLKEDDRFVHLQVGAGENWHDFVHYSLSMGWGGLENLSLIPGSVGAAPVQNIGAYGVEVESFILAVDVYDVVDRSVKTITHFECMFGYRDSVFKRVGLKRFIIMRVWFRLEKNRRPVLNYAPLRDHFLAVGIEEPTLMEVSEAVIGIRRSKLPDPAVIGNAGSFFKNPVIDTVDLERLVNLNPTIPYYPADEGIKVPAGWLIEQCGWKGFREGAVGCYHKQALVLVHFGGGEPADLIDLARRIRTSVEDRFSVHLEAEVNIVGDRL
jgi:UDP-N-acetylmuramate dehydrogenase